MDLLIDLPCRRLRLALDEGSDRTALLAEIRARRGADPPRCLADPGRPCGPGRPCAFRSRRDTATRRPPDAARGGRAADRPDQNGRRRRHARCGSGVAGPGVVANALFAASMRRKSPFAAPARDHHARGGSGVQRFALAGSRWPVHTDRARRARVADVVTVP